MPNRKNKLVEKIEQSGIENQDCESEKLQALLEVDPEKVKAREKAAKKKKD